MATAKQIAWRKKFAAMSRAGVFANPGARSEVRGMPKGESTRLRNPGQTTYRGHTFNQSNKTSATSGKLLYEVDGEFKKSAATRPFLTSVAAVKKYINESYDYYDDRRVNPGARNSTAANVALATNPIQYKVQSRTSASGSWTTIVRTRYEADAIKTAKALHAAYPNRSYRVID